MIKKIYIYISFIYIILFKITTILHDESAPSELKSDGSSYTLHVELKFLSGRTDDCNVRVSNI